MMILILFSLLLMVIKVEFLLFGTLVTSSNRFMWPIEGFWWWFWYMHSFLQVSFFFLNWLWRFMECFRCLFWGLCLCVNFHFILLRSTYFGVLVLVVVMELHEDDVLRFKEWFGNCYWCSFKGILFENEFRWFWKFIVAILNRWLVCHECLVGVSFIVLIVSLGVFSLL